MKALIIDNVNPCIKEYLDTLMQVDVHTFLTQEELAGIIGEYEILIMRQNPAISPMVMEAAKKLKLICCHCVGTNHVDKKYAEKKGIKVVNAVGQNANAVAELAISKMIDLSRHTMPAYEDVKRNGAWNKYAYHGTEIYRKTLGLIGFGNVGKRVTAIAKGGFDMRVLAYDPFVSPEKGKEFGVEILDFDSVIQQADYISIHVPLTDETKNMFSTAEFEKMKDTAYLLGMSRGGIIDEAAAYEALKAKKIAGISVDVMADELVGEGISKTGGYKNPLFELDSFTVSPHIAGWTAEADENIGTDILRQIKEYLEEK